jgi:hypothetical protein
LAHPLLFIYLSKLNIIRAESGGYLHCDIATIKNLYLDFKVIEQEKYIYKLFNSGRFTVSPKAQFELELEEKFNQISFYGLIKMVFTLTNEFFAVKTKEASLRYINYL